MKKKLKKKNKKSIKCNERKHCLCLRKGDREGDRGREREREGERGKKERGREGRKRERQEKNQLLETERVEPRC